MSSANMASLKFLGSEENSGHLWSTSFHDGEYDGWHIFPSKLLSSACHMSYFAIFDD